MLPCSDLCTLFFLSSSSSIRSSHNSHSDYSDTIIRYLCVSVQSANYGKVVIEFIMFASVLVHALHTKAQQILTSLHKC